MTPGLLGDAIKMLHPLPNEYERFFEILTSTYGPKPYAPAPYVPEPYCPG